VEARVVYEISKEITAESASYECGI